MANLLVLDDTPNSSCFPQHLSVTSLASGNGISRLVQGTPCIAEVSQPVRYLNLCADEFYFCFLIIDIGSRQIAGGLYHHS